MPWCVWKFSHFLPLSFSFIYTACIVKISFSDQIIWFSQNLSVELIIFVLLDKRLIACIANNAQLQPKFYPAKGDVY